MKIKVTFIYNPDEPDPDHSTGMSEEEYNHLMNEIMGIGGYDVEISRESDE